MTSLAGLLERLSPDSVVLNGAPGAITAPALCDAARAIAGLLPGGVSRLLVQSGDARSIAAHLLAAEARGISLFLAHEHLGAEEVEAVVQAHAIEAVSISGQRLRLTAAKPAQVDGWHIYLMTSGTTNAPKVARHSLSALLGRVGRFIGDQNLQTARWLLTYSPTTFAGMQVILTALATGGCLIVPPSRTVPALREAAAKYGATHISGTPTFWRSLLMLCSSQSALPDLRQITLGGEAVDQKTLNRLRSAFPQARITHIYASTEAGALFSVDDGRSGFPANWLEQPGGDIWLRIQDGELHVRSPRRMEGYASPHDNPFLDDGWLRTGDLVRQDGDRIQFAGRTDTTINVGGMKVLPLEVEESLLLTEGVVEARVSGVANPIAGQLVVAEIVVEPGRDAQQVAQAAAEHARAHLAAYKVPRSIRVVDSIATSQAGKKLNTAALG